MAVEQIPTRAILLFLRCKDRAFSTVTQYQHFGILMFYPCFWAQKCHFLQRNGLKEEESPAQTCDWTEDFVLF